jgi:23S rRNA (adenine2503-C2)-methyltransferase
MVLQTIFVSKFLKKTNERITNVVFMGMGEPFLNYDTVIETIKILNDKDKFNIGARHITVSTSGIVPKIYEYAKFPLQTRLAISLHAPNNKLRDKIMPINKRYPLEELMKACDEFVKIKNKRVSYEYVLIDGINDSIKEAKELVELLKNRKAHVNLLIYNPHEFSNFKKPKIENVRKFKEFLNDNGIECSIRKSMGDDISGACGQLSGKKEKEKKIN